MLVDRLKSAIPLLILLCIAFFAPMNVGAVLFAIMALVMAYVGSKETFNLLAPTFRKRHLYLAFLMGLLLILPPMAEYLARHTSHEGLATAFQAIRAAYPALFAFGILTAFTHTYRHDPTRENVHGILASIGAFVLVAWQISFLVSIYFYPTCPGFIAGQEQGNGDPRFLLFYMIIVTKMADVGAFTVGVNAAKRPGGNHLLAPKISPRKSWEGLLGGTLFSLITSLLFAACAMPQLRLNGVQIVGWADAVFIGIMASPLGLLGDLSESALKRSANAKDSGTLPGLGGILDTLDSLLPMGPFFYAYITLKLMA